MSTSHERLRREAHISSERGAALASSVLILVLMTVFATSGFWLARAELGAAQGYAQAARALYSAEAGFARYFASRVAGDSIAATFEIYTQPCQDLVNFPTLPEQAACMADDEGEEEELLEDLEMETPLPQTYAFLNAEVIVTVDFAMNEGITPVYEIFARATVEDPRDPALTTTRLLAMYGQMAPPFEINSTFAALGGITFGGDADDHYHLDGKAKKGKNGKCGTDVSIPSLTIPTGQWDLPLTDPACPGGKACPYKWHSKGLNPPNDVDSTLATATAIKADIGIEWAQFLNDPFYNGVTNVFGMNNSDDLEAFFDKDKSKLFKSAPEWPIVRFTGDLTTDVRVKGYGILIVDGDVIVQADKLEWTGVIMVGGRIISQDGSHLHVKGAAIAGLGCTEQEVTDGDCRSVLDGDHNDIKYRPCEVAQAWRRLMIMEPRDGLWRETTIN